MSILKAVIFVTLCAVLVNDAYGQDNPCQARKYNQSSIVCVCNADYCDEVSKVNPLSSGKYVLYSSSNEGQRFEKSFGNLVRKTIKPNIPAWSLVDWLNRVSSFADAAVIEINRDVTYQTIEGFGGSFTDAAGINLQTLSQGAQDNFVKSYFSEKGLEYNVGRVPIGGSDFSTHPYAYNMQPTDDIQLSNFSLTEEDYTLKLPLIQQAIAHATEDLHILATAWSPPVWMKTNGEFGGESRLIDKYYQTWADYHLRFLQEYKKNNVSIWAISTGNEPSNGIIPILAFNSLGWMPSDQARWVAENLGPTIKHSEFKDIKILALDDQRFSLPWWIEWLAENKDTMQYIDGVAIHWYWDDLIGPSSLDRTHNAFPDKFLLGTEACVGDKPWQTEKVELGSWSRAEMYVKDILEGLNHWYVGWIDWNLALSREGGPNWFNNFVDAGVIVLPDSDEFLKQPLFYAVGHFSKFIPRGSVRVEVKELTGFVDHVAFLRPDNGIVVVFYNPYDSDKTLTIQEKDKGNIQVDVPARSVHSLIYW